MPQYWVDMKDGSAFCMLVDYRELERMRLRHTAKGEINFDALLPEKDKFLMDAASQFGEVATIRTLPYPAEPTKPYKPEYKGDCPSFCYEPRVCAGKTSCPKNRSCCD